MPAGTLVIDSAPVRFNAVVSAGATSPQLCHSPRLVPGAGSSWQLDDDAGLSAAAHDRKQCERTPGPARKTASMALAIARKITASSIRDGSAGLKPCGYGLRLRTLYRTIPRRTAQSTSSAVLCRSSFSMTCARCVSTVAGLMWRSSATSLFE